MESRVILITQARIGSSRLPSKVMKEIGGISLLEMQLIRIMQCKTVDEIIVAIPSGDDQRPIQNICKKLGIQFYQGSEVNVLERFYLTGKKFKADWIVRITSDCPLIDPELIDHITNKVISGNKDYGSNTLVESYPDGQDIEVFKFSVLEDSISKVELNSDKEHVTPFIKRNCDTHQGTLYSSISFVSDIDYSSVRMTVDEVQDFEAISLLVSKFGIFSTWKEYTNYILNNISEFSNQKILRNEGYFRSLQND